MLDTTAFTMDWPHVPFGEEVNADRESRGKHETWRETKLLDGRYPWTSMTVRSRKGERIYIEASAKSLQGHNLFGSNNMRARCYYMASLALDRLGIEYTPMKLRRAVAKARLSRVDIACSVKLPPGIPCGEVVNALAIAAIRDGRPLGYCYGHESVVLKRGTLPSHSFYDKSQEMEAHSVAELEAHGLDAAYLAEFADQVLRFEIRCLRGWLRSHHLGRVKNWSIGFARQLIANELQSAFTPGPLHVRITKAVPDGLSKAKKQALRIWLDGHALDEFYGATSRSTYRRAFLEAFKIDIATTAPRVGDMPIDVAGLLDESRVVLGYPRRGRKLGLVALAALAPITRFIAETDEEGRWGG